MANTSILTTSSSACLMLMQFQNKLCWIFGFIHSWKLLPRTMLLIRSEIWTSLVLDCRKVGEFILVKKNQCHQVFVEFLIDTTFYVKSIIRFWKGNYFHFDNFIISLLDAVSKQTLLDLLFHPLLKNFSKNHGAFDT